MVGHISVISVLNESELICLHISIAIVSRL